MAWNAMPLFSVNRLFSRPARVLVLASAIILLVLGLVNQSKRTVFTGDIPFKPISVETPTVRSEKLPSQEPLPGDAEFINQTALKVDMNCGADAKHLSDLAAKYQLDHRFEYLKRHVRFIRTPGLQRKLMTHVKQPLLEAKSAFHTVTLGKGTPVESTCPSPIEVPVPKSGFPQTANASDFMFGVSTTYERIMSSETSPMEEWRFWLTDGNNRSNGGKLLLFVLDATPDQMQDLATMLGDIGIDVEVYRGDPSLPMAVRYFKLIPTLYSHPDAQRKKWLVACDDDTFFPSMHRLVERFRTINHTRQMYVGTLSEDFKAVEVNGPQAFGGAGVFLSVPLARRVTELYRSCLDQRERQKPPTDQGDALLRNCIYDNTNTRLVHVPELWQLDLVGDVSGFYESGISPLSLHHFHSWHRAAPKQLARIAYRCGEACTMLRFQTPDDYIVSGFSVAHYPKGIDFDTDQVEGTMAAAVAGQLDYKLGSQRPSLSRTGRKMAWELREAHFEPDGSIRQTYTRKKDDDRWKDTGGRKMSNVDGVIELVWASL